MKKIIWAMMLAMAALAFVSCDKLGQQNNTDLGGEVNGEENIGTSGKPSEELQPNAQKTKISEVGQKLMDKLPAEDWKKYSEFAEAFAESVYVSDYYDWGTIEEWFEGKGEGAYKEDYSEVFKNGTVTFNETYELLLLMSNFEAHFDCTENGVVIKDYKGGTKATFKLNGKNYVAEIKSQGKVTNAIYVYEDYDEYKGYDYYDEYGNLVAENVTKIYKDKEKFTIGVPEKILVSLTENGSPLMEVEAVFAPNFSKDGIELTTDSFATSVKISINGFEIATDKTAFNAATGKAEAKFAFRKNGESLFSTSASADVKIRMEEKSWEDEWYDSWADRTYSEKHTYEYVVADKVQNITASLDIIGEIQAKATCTDALEAYESIDAMWEALSSYDYETGYSKTPNESEARRHLNNFNSKMSINVYYDGGTNSQAKVEFELACDKYDYSWGTEEYWYTIPVIVFNDGSKYKVEEFFTENAFNELINSFYEFCESYDKVLGFTMEY